MNVRRVVLVVFGAVLLLAAVRAGLARPAGGEASAVAAADAQILTEIHNHSQAIENLEYLSDEIGPRLTHHSQADTLDRVHWEDLTEGAQVLAAFAYHVAQLPEMLPRKPAKPSGN